MLKELLGRSKTTQNLLANHYSDYGKLYMVHTSKQLSLCIIYVMKNFYLLILLSLLLFCLFLCREQLWKSWIASFNYTMLLQIMDYKRERIAVVYTLQKLLLVSFQVHVHFVRYSSDCTHLMDDSISIVLVTFLYFLDFQWSQDNRKLGKSVTIAVAKIVTVVISIIKIYQS